MDLPILNEEIFLFCRTRSEDSADWIERISGTGNAAGGI